MSLKRDYILRIIEQLAQALATALRLRKKGAHEEAIAEVASAAAGIAGLDLRMAASVDAPTLSAHVPEPPRLAALYAELRRLRESRGASVERLLAIRSAAAEFSDDWLLRTEVDELLPAGGAAAHAG